MIAAVVLCGGTSMRMGGQDKTAADLHGRSVLDALVSSLPADWPVVCVGDPRELSREVIWAREDPPLGGPVAGLAAGIAAAPGDAEIVVVLAGDQPFAGPTVRDCADALDRHPDLDGIAALQEDGRLQPLLAAYRRVPLAAAVSGTDPDTGVYKTLSSLSVAGLDADSLATLDVDTPADLDDARRHAAG